MPRTSATTWVSTPRPQQSALDPYIDAIRGHALLVLLVMGAVVAASVAWLALRAPEYRSSAEILVTPLPAETVAIVGIPVIQDLRDPTRTIQTAAELVDSQAAAQRTARALGNDWTRRKVSAAVDVQPKGETNILQVTAVAETPDLAARLANTFAESALSVRRATMRAQAAAAIPSVRARLRQLPPGSGGVAELQTKLNRLEALRTGQDPTLSLAQRATPSSSQVGPSAAMVLALALLAGAVLGVGTALAVDRLTPARVTSEEELVDIFPLPILARLPILSRQLRGTLSLDVQPEAREALRTVQLQLDLRDGRPRTVMITSPSPGDGKTTTAVALGVTIADAGAQVVLIDTDVRRMPIRASLDADSEAMPSASRGRPTPSSGKGSGPPLGKLLRRVAGHPNFQLLDAMDAGFDSTDASARGRFAELVRAAKKEFDYVLLDTPPIGVISDALTLLDLVDDVLIVAKIRDTRRLHVEVARDLLGRARVTPAGYIVIGERTLGSYPYPIPPLGRG